MASTEAALMRPFLTTHHSHHGNHQYASNDVSSGSNSQQSTGTGDTRTERRGGGRVWHRSNSKPRRVMFYKNGDRYFGGKLITVPTTKHYSIRDLMNELSKSVDLPYGVRRVYTPVSGREIMSIDELVDGSSYVCASFEPFRSVRYGIISRTSGDDRQMNSNFSSKMNEF